MHLSNLLPSYTKISNTMASTNPIAIITPLLLLLLISLSPTTLSQTIANCAPSLLPLTPCAPFVQGSAQTPTQPCCDNLKQVYDQQPDCLCLLLNNTAISSLPINATLALQLPVLCSLQLNSSTCSGMPEAASPPTSQVSMGTKANSTVAASPMVTVTPKPSILGLGFGRSAGMKLKARGALAMVILAAATAILLTEVLF